MSCLLCDRVELTKIDKYPYLIHEYKNSYLMLGEHQFFKGYCVLISKHHYKEMTDAPKEIQRELFEELMKAHETIEKVFSPTKMNLCSLGNVVSHVHWHLFPRYKEDDQFKDPPWLRMSEFSKAAITEEEAREIIVKIRSRIVE